MSTSEEGGREVGERKKSGKSGKDGDEGKRQETRAVKQGSGKK